MQCSYSIGKQMVTIFRYEMSTGLFEAMYDNSYYKMRTPSQAYFYWNNIRKIGSQLIVNC